MSYKQTHTVQIQTGLSGTIVAQSAGLFSITADSTISKEAAIHSIQLFLDRLQAQLNKEKEEQVAE